MRRVWLAGFFAVFALAASAADEVDLRAYEAVDIAPVKTSIYVGSVTLSAPVFHRHEGVYSSTYTAKVFPFFFYNEHGTLSITVSDDMLRRLARNETIEFTGEGLSSDQEPRHVEGKATPIDARSGKIKVRIFVSKRIQLIFNTTYRFVP